MKDVLVALKAMGKATCREISARLRKDNREMLEILERMEGVGEIHAVNGYWYVGRAGSPEMAEGKTKKETAVAEQPKPTTPEAIAEQLRKHGPMGTTPLAGIFCRSGRGMASILCSLAMSGAIVKNGTGRGVTWSLPEVSQADEFDSVSTSDTQEPVAPVADPDANEPAEPKSTEALLHDIPVFTRRSTDLILPTTAGINSELRRARARVASLEKLRDMSREIRRHKKLILSLRGEA
ncbi:TPA: hypothetical protein ACP41M_001097 [Klebsiella aerogenes]